MFVGHITDVKADFKKPLLQYNKRKLLVNNGDQFFICNNVCPHQGSLIVSKCSKNISCQYHGWSWDSQGQPTSAGSTALANNSKLSMVPVYSYNGLLFTYPVNLSRFRWIPFRYFRLVEERIDTVNTDATNIVDVFLDVDHIPVVHQDVYPGIGISDAADVDWEYFDWGSVQVVSKSGEYSTEFAETLIGADEERIAAFWVTLYPGTMIEWQPGALFVTVCIPNGKNTDVVVMKYRDTRYSDTNWKLNSEIWELAWAQDRHQAESIVYTCNFPPHLEPSKMHYRNWQASRK